MTAVSTDRSSDLAKASGHVLRQRILVRLDEGVASPSEMAKEFEESLPLVSYHVRILDELNCVELVRTTPRRGAIEHHYELSVDGRRAVATYASATVRQKLGAALALLEEARRLKNVGGREHAAIAAAESAVGVALSEEE